MIKSMTGYGRGEYADENYSFTVEMRSVNHRFLETVVRMPRAYSALEDLVKKTVAEGASRGRIDVMVAAEKVENKRKVVKVDKELALAYYNSLKELGDNLNLSNSVQLLDIARFPDVVTMEEADVDLEQLAGVLTTAVKTALNQMVKMREAEGTRLRKDFLMRIEKLADFRAQISERAPSVVTEYQEKLHKRIKELLDNVDIDETRLANEVAFFADRASIAEELTRLASHLEQFRLEMDSNEPIGRKLDFLVQEMNREVNTIGSKANDLVISTLVISAKSEIEKIREQVQNIE